MFFQQQLYGKSKKTTATTTEQPKTVRPKDSFLPPGGTSYNELCSDGKFDTIFTGSDSKTYVLKGKLGNKYPHLSIFHVKIFFQVTNTGNSMTMVIRLQADTHATQKHCGMVCPPILTLLLLGQTEGPTFSRWACNCLRCCFVGSNEQALHFFQTGLEILALHQFQIGQRVPEGTVRRLRRCTW